MWRRECDWESNQGQTFIELSWRLFSPFSAAKKGTDRRLPCLQTAAISADTMSKEKSMRISRLTAVSAAALLVGGVGLAAAQTSSGSGTSGSGMTGANTDCWDKAINKVRPNTNNSGTTATGSASGSVTSGNSGTGTTSAAATSPSSASASANASTRPPGMRDCPDD
jgi:hypothetical protein